MNRDKEISSADIYILLKVNELTQRFGLHPLDVDATISYYIDDQEEVLNFQGNPEDPSARVKYEAMLKAIGCPGGELHADSLVEIGRVLDAALRRAPRGRTR